MSHAASWNLALEGVCRKHGLQPLASPDAVPAISFQMPAEDKAARAMPAAPNTARAGWDQAIVTVAAQRGLAIG